MPVLTTPIYQYDKSTGQLIQKFHSIYEARHIANIGNIVSCLKGNRPSAGGFVWEYVYDLHKNKDNRNTVTLMLDGDMNIVERFPSTLEAAQYIIRKNPTKNLKIDYVIGYITRNMIGNYKPGTLFGYKWMAQEKDLV